MLCQGVPLFHTPQAPHRAWLCGEQFFLSSYYILTPPPPAQAPACPSTKIREKCTVFHNFRLLVHLHVQHRFVPKLG